MNDITAKVESVKSPERPEPPPFPDLYILTWWEWKEADKYFRTVSRWEPRASMFPRDREQLTRDATELKANGCRNIRLVTIPGESTPGEGGAQ